MVEPEAQPTIAPKRGGLVVIWLAAWYEHDAFGLTASSH